MALIRTIAGLKSGRVLELKSGTLVFGRNPRKCDVLLDHFAVSREHARITFIDGIAYLEDLESRNGVLLNGQVIPAGSAGRQRLYSGDRFRIATFEFVYDEDPSSEVHVSQHGSGAGEVLSSLDVSGDSTTSGGGRSSAGGSTILGILEELPTASDPGRVLSKILDNLFQTFSFATCGTIFLRDDRDSGFLPAAVRRRDDEGPMEVSQELLDSVISQKAAILTSNSGRGSQVPSGKEVTPQSSRTVMCVPLMRSGEILGIVQLEAPREAGEFTERDLAVLGGVARHLASAIEASCSHIEAMRSQRDALELRFRGLIEGSVQGILVHRQFRPLFVNEAFARLHGCSVDEILSLASVLPLLADDDPERGIVDGAQLESVPSLPMRYESQGRRKDGTTIWLEKFVSVVEWVDGPAFQIAVIDATDRKRADDSLRNAHADLEQCVARRTAELAEANVRLEREVADRKRKEYELRDSESLYHSLVDHIPLGVARKDLRGVYTFANRALAEQLGCPAQAIVGHRDEDLFPSSDVEKYRRDDEAVLATGQLLDLFETVTLPNASVLHMHTLKTPIRDAEQRIVGVQLVAWDVSAQMDAEAERNRYAKELERSNRDLEQFAYSVSHDLQSPLRTVTNYCQLLQMEASAKLTDDEAECLKNAVEGARRMKRLLDDLLAYSRVSTAGHGFQSCDADAILTEAIRNIQASVAESGAVITSGGLPTLVCDRTQLMMLFQNLLGNAIAYRRGVSPRIHVDAVEHPEKWEFRVSDNGMGIAAEHYDRVFQVLQRLHSDDEIPGSGLGLAISQRIVERHGGRIWLESVVGQGSTFHFTMSKTPQPNGGEPGRA